MCKIIKKQAKMERISQYAINKKTCIWNAFGYSEQYNKKSGSMTVKRRKLVKYYHLYFYSIDVNEENRRIKFESE